MNAFLIIVVLLIAAAAVGRAILAIAKAAVATFDHMQQARRAKAVQNELAARRARMARFSMSQLSGTRASERHS